MSKPNSKENQVQIHIVGVTQTADLVGGALLAVHQASAIIGSERQLEIVRPVISSNKERNSGFELYELPKLAQLLELIESLSAKQTECETQTIVVLASGDPLYYGIGRWFSNNVHPARLVFHPAISSIQMACHRLALSLQDVNVHSVHGRPLASLRTKLRNNATLVILTDKNSQPQALAQQCLDTGFEQSSITVLENLSYADERVRSFSVNQLLESPELEFEPLHVSVIEVKGAGGVLPQFPGIADTAYMTGEQAGKGMITKREVRLCILSLMQAGNQDVIWDIGAGCGGVAVELAFWNDTAKVFAVECHAERLKHLKTNQQRFGVVQNLHIVDGQAPECLEDLPRPNKIFVGGSGGNMKLLLDALWPVLPEGGLLVVSAVVANTRQALRDFAQHLSNEEISQVEVVEVAVKRGQFIDAELDYTAKLPVEVFKFTKGKTSNQKR